MGESLDKLLQRANAGDAEAQNAIGRSLAQSGHRMEAAGWWRPLSCLDAAMTGMRHHIGPHR